MFVFAYCFLHGDIVFLVYYGHYCQQQCYAYSESFRRGEILVGYMPLGVSLQYKEKNLFMLVKWNWTKSLFLLAKGKKIKTAMKRVKEWRCIQEQITDLTFKATKRKMTMNTSLLFSLSVTCHFPSLNLTCFSFLLCANKVCCLTYLVSSLLFSIITWFSFKESLSFNLRLYGLDGTKFTTSSRGKHMTQTHDLSLNNLSHRD